MDVNELLRDAGRWLAGPGLWIALTLAAALAVVTVIRGVSSRFTTRLEQCPPNKHHRLIKGCMPVCCSVFVVLIVLLAMGVVLEILGVSIAGLLETTAGQWLIGSGLKVLLIVALLVAALRLMPILLDRGFVQVDRCCCDAEMKKRADTLKSIIRKAVSILLVVVAVLMIMDNIGLDIGPILAAAGVVGIGVGFGAEQLVRDVICGFFILVDNQVRVGDVVNVAGQAGLVEQVGLRKITLRDGSGDVHFVRNGHIAVVTNMTKDYSRYVLDVPVAYREDVDEVIAVLKQINEDIRQDPAWGPDILEPLEVLGLDRFADSAVIVRARIKTLPRRQFAIGREFNRRMKKTFDAMGIEIPLPHMTLYMGQGKDGAAGPLHLHTAAVKNGSGRTTDP